MDTAAGEGGRRAPAKPSSCSRRRGTVSSAFLCARGDGCRRRARHARARRNSKLETRLLQGSVRTHHLTPPAGDIRAAQLAQIRQKLHHAACRHATRRGTQRGIQSGSGSPLPVPPICAGGSAQRVGLQENKDGVRSCGVCGRTIAAQRQHVGVLR